MNDIRLVIIHDGGSLQLFPCSSARLLAGTVRASGRACVQDQVVRLSISCHLQVARSTLNATPATEAHSQADQIVAVLALMLAAVQAAALAVVAADPSPVRDPFFRSRAQ